MKCKLYVRSTLIIFFVFVTSCSDHRKKPKKIVPESSGKVVGIIDGDTYDLLLSNDSTIRIRMAGIDAPEKGMPFYRTSKKYLGTLCYLKTVRYEKTDTDKDNRIVAFTYTEDSVELGLEMIKNGMAWHFKRYSSDTTLARLELEAKANHIGLWQEEDPIPPWEIRKLHHDGISTKDSFDIKTGWD